MTIEFESFGQQVGLKMIGTVPEEVPLQGSSRIAGYDYNISVTTHFFNRSCQIEEPDGPMSRSCVHHRKHILFSISDSSSTSPGA
jgi:hypothetical protein